MVELDDKTTPTPLLIGDLVKIGAGRQVWEVAYLADPKIGTPHAKRNMLLRGDVTRYISWSQIWAGKLTRADGSLIEEAQGDARTKTQEAEEAWLELSNPSTLST